MKSKWMFSVTEQTFHLAWQEPKRIDQQANKILMLQTLHQILPIYILYRFNWNSPIPRRCSMHFVYCHGREILIELKSELSNVQEINFNSIYQLITVCPKTINNNNFHSLPSFFLSVVSCLLVSINNIKHSTCHFSGTTLPCRPSLETRNEAWALCIDMTHNSFMKNCLLDIHKH